MSTVTITPVPRSADERAKAPARLATTMLEVLAAGATDAPRFQRGRAYARDGAVVALHVSTGRLEAEVAGSRAGDYEVTIDVALAAGAAGTAPTAAHELLALVPEADDVQFSCTCPDWEDPCKHAVAALMAFAGEVGERPDLLRLWRVGPTERAKIGAARADAAAPRTRSAPPNAAILPPWEQPEWRQFLGTADDAPADPGVRELLAPLPPARAETVGQVDVGALVDSARLAVAVAIDRTRHR